MKRQSRQTSHTAQALKALQVPLVMSLFLMTAVASPEAMAKDSTNWQSAFEAGQKAQNQFKLDEAERQFRTAYRLSGSQSKQVGDQEKCMLKLASILLLQDKTMEAKTLYLKLLKQISNRHGAKSAELEPVLMALGSIEESAGDHARAMVYYNRALKITESHDGVYSPAYARSLSSVGRINGKLGNKAMARSQYKQAISILSKEPNRAASEQLKAIMHEYGDLMEGQDNSNSDLLKDFDKDVLDKKDTSSAILQEPDYLESANLRPAISGGTDRLSLSESGKDRSQFESLNRFQLNATRKDETDTAESVVLRGISQPSTDKALAPAYEVLSDTIFNQQRYSRSEEQYKRKVAIDIDSLGANHPSLGNDLNALAQLYIARARYSEAKPLLEKALKIYDSTYGVDNVLAINTRAALAQVEFELGNYEQASALFSTALSQGEKSLGPNSLSVAKILNGLAYLYYHQGKLDKAQTFYEWAVSSTQSAVGSQDPLLAACLRDYARVLRSMGKDKKAEVIELRADGILARSN